MTRRATRIAIALTAAALAAAVTRVLSAAPTTQPAAVAAPPPVVKTDPASRLHAAVDQLILESKDLDNFGKIKNPLHFRRPHPLLKDLGPDIAITTLERMFQPFTNNEYRDTYIRWHLMWVVRQMSDTDRRDSAPRLVELFRKMPGPLKVAWRVEHIYEPLDMYQKYIVAVGGAPSANAVIGYPPFQRVIGPPESYKYLPPGTEAKLKLDLIAYNKRVAEATKLYVFTHRVDADAVAFNQRVREMSEVLRHYRGELMYNIIASGNSETGKLVMSELVRMAKDHNGIAFDLLAYIYLAVFDGALNKYDQPTLDEMSLILEGGAKASEGYVTYAGIQRNFADSAFHLIQMLKDGGGFIDPERVPLPTSAK